MEETGTTIEENAALKALEASKHTDDYVIADDSGFSVDAMGGAPGVYSNRWLGHEASAPELRQAVLEKLRNEKNRRAVQICAMALAHKGKLLHTVRGEMPGIVTRQARLGELKDPMAYDPIFIPDGYDKTVAQLGLKEKGKISHRGAAAR